MLAPSLLSPVAKQLMSADEVEVGGKRLPVRRTSKQGLRTVTFTVEGRQYAAIEQNPDKPSRWGVAWEREPHTARCAPASPFLKLPMMVVPSNTIQRVPLCQGPCDRWL